MSANLKEAYELKRINSRERLAYETEVQRKKWFDYRFVPAAEATRLFADTYVEVYREKWASYMDRDTATLKQPLSQTPKRGEQNALWMARIAADELCVPYRVFMQASIDAASSRGCRKFPRPNQLYHELSIPEIIRKWEELRRTRLQFSRDPIYMNENFQGLPEQIQHRKWVIGELRTLGSPSHLIEDAVNSHRILTEDDVRRAFGEAAARVTFQAPHKSSSSGSHYSAFPIRSCFALTGPVAGDAICNDCAHTRKCTKAAGALDEIIVKKFGCNDAHKGRVRKQTSERVRRYRARREAAKAAAAHTPAT